MEGVLPIDVDGFGSFIVAPRSTVISACGQSVEIGLSIEGSKAKEMLHDVRQAAKKLLNDLENLRFCVSPKDFEVAATFIPRVNSCMTWMYEPRILLSLTELIPIFDLIDNLVESLIHIEKDMIALREKYKKKSQFLRDLREKGFEYTTGYELKKLMSQIQGHVLLVSISDSFDYSEVIENLQFALKIKDNLKCKLYIVDEDLGDEEQLRKKSFVVHYKDGVCLCVDVQSACTSSNLIECKDPLKTIDENSEPERALFKVPCPKCNGSPVTWTCKTCTILIEFCFNGSVVCNCGWSTLGMLNFKCGQYFHESFTPCENLEVLSKETRSIQPAKQTNILLVGQSGAGKSTWINGFVNYLKSAEFDVAVKGEIITLMPVQFTICDEKSNSFQVNMRGDEYEDLTVGASATQTSRSYILYRGRERITLIDTPGLGDTRGYEQDVSNIRGIVQHLKTVPKVHGICFVLMPNETRLNTLMSFVIQEIFVNLHTSAKDNIFFLFTNSRSTNYRGGSSLQLLDKIINKFRNVQNFALSDRNTYYFDNEAFRFLCALKETSVTFSDEEKLVYKNSWIHTGKELSRFLHHVSKVAPYDASKSLDIHRVRSSLSLLVSKKVDQKSGQSVENLEDAVARNKEAIATLKESHFEVRKVLKTSPSVSRIVCAAVKCHEVHNDSKFYKTTCYTPFAVQPAFLKCLSAAPIQSAPIMQNGVCTKCQCFWEAHMVIDFSQNIVDMPQENTKVGAEIEKLNLEVELWENMISAQKNKSSSSTPSEEFLSKKLGKFLAQNSLLLYNDATDDYLAYLIDSAGVKSDKTNEDFDRIDKLKDVKEKNKEADQVIKPFENMLFVACDRNSEVIAKDPSSEDMVGRGTSVVIQL